MLTRLISVILLGALFSVNHLYPVRVNAAEWNDAEIEAMAERAEETVRRAFDFLWNYRLEVDLADSLRDPDQTGVIGIQFSPLTTTNGNIDAKRLSTRRGWAGWIVRELARRGIYPRAQVAVSLSGSFPGMNIVVLSALQELGVSVKAISSVGASSWGANELGFTWPEMERMLHEEGILKIGSSAVTLGGAGDRGAEWGDYARNLALEAVRRSRLPLIKPLNLRDAVRKRIQFYGFPSDYVCYINVGGGQASMGTGTSIRFNRGGWFFEPPTVKGNPNGVMDRFLEADIPCLNLLYLEDLSQVEKVFHQKP